MAFSDQRLHNLDPDQVGQAAMTVFDRLQLQFPPEEQAAGAALAFLFVCRKHGLHAGTVLNAANNYAERAAERTSVIRAALEYAQKEL